MPGRRYFDQKSRAAEKAEARHRDAADLVAGRVTREELSRSNDFFAGLDVAAFEIVAVGATAISAFPDDGPEVRGGGTGP